MNAEVTNNNMSIYVIFRKPNNFLSVLGRLVILLSVF